MDWKLVGTTFLTVFLAELGDKTQLATPSFASSASAKLSVFLGSAAALVATSAVAVLAGEVLGRAIPPLVLQRLAGVAFVVIGAWLVVSTLAGEGRASGGARLAGAANGLELLLDER